MRIKRHTDMLEFIRALEISSSATNSLSNMLREAALPIKTDSWPTAFAPGEKMLI